jgi:hypothetical protein
VSSLQLLLALASAVILGSESLGPTTVLYCLTFEISIFVASYDSQGCDGGIRTRLHTGSDYSQSYVTTYGQSASQFDVKHQSGAQDQICITVRQFRVC